MKITKNRCAWVTEDPLYIKYHDEEWGVPTHDDGKMFEFLVLESAQAGLSWLTVLRKRENYRLAFADFDPRHVAEFGARDVARLLKNPGVIRNRQKIEAAINNAQRFLETQREFGTFSKYLWRFVDDKPKRHILRRLADYPKFTPEAEKLAKDLKQRGFKFLGPTVIYAHMQAVGLVNDHMVDCFLASNSQKLRL